MNFIKCAWPGCNNSVVETRICGDHQLALRLVLQLIISACAEYRMTGEDAIAVALLLGPIIAAKPTMHSTYSIVESVSNQTVVELFRSTGFSRRGSFNRAVKLRRDDTIPTELLVRAIVADRLWVTVGEAAGQLGFPHRYLRHLVYEDNNESLMRLVLINPLVGGQVGFSKNTLTELGEILKGVDKRRGR
ncbi:MAG: hypothetical protein NTV39_00365 [Candidatus Saccharibacteria bacterium]|nr:hypothetical protein [Candidatus Saccharibacteria bacterium]